jgi:mediator of RNA polymerase II transcription subunit 6
MPANPDGKSTATRGGLSKEGTPLPDSAILAGKARGASGVAAKKASAESGLDWLADESFAIHMKYGGEFIDENPITGRPGEFLLSSTGRKDKTATSAASALQSGKSAAGTPAATAKAGEEPKKPGKSPRQPNMPKPKRRKSKIGGGAGA